MIRPVRIKHAHFGDRGGTPFALEIALAAKKVVKVHRKAKAFMERNKPFPVQLQKARKRLHAIGRFQRSLQRFNRRKRSFPAFHRVDHIMLHSGKRSFIHRAKEHVDLCRAHKRALPLGDQLDALARRVCALVELARQGFHRKYGSAICRRQRFIYIIHRRLGEYGGYALAKQRLADPLHIIAVKQPEARNHGKAKQRLQLIEERLGFICLRWLFFYKNTINHTSSFIWRLRRARVRRCLCDRTRFQTKLPPPHGRPFLELPQACPLWR